MGTENTMNTLNIYVEPGDVLLNRNNSRQMWRIVSSMGGLRFIPIDNQIEGATTYHIGPGDWIHCKETPELHWTARPMQAKGTRLAIIPAECALDHIKEEQGICKQEVDTLRAKWPSMPHPEDDKDCDKLCGSEDLHSTITADVCRDLALSCENPSYVHKAEGDWVRYILETCKAAAMNHGHLWYNFGLRWKIDWNTVGQLIEERGFVVTFFDRANGNRYRPGDLGGIPGSVDSMNVYWGRCNSAPN